MEASSKWVHAEEVPEGENKAVVMAAAVGVVLVEVALVVGGEVPEVAGAKDEAVDAMEWDFSDRVC